MTSAQNGRQPIISEEQLLVPFGSNLVSLVVHVTRPAGRVRGTVFCFHGFTGNGRDFSGLAALLAGNGFVVVCPDMIGRGDSGYFARAQQYGFRNILQGALAVLKQYRSNRSSCVCVGWGGLIALVAAQSQPGVFRKMLISSLSLRYRIPDDPGISDARAAAGQRFGSLTEVRDALLATKEFTGADFAISSALGHRVRQTEDGQFAFNFDDAIVARYGDYADREFDVAQLLEGSAAECLVLGPQLDTGHQALSARVAIAARPNNWQGHFLDPLENLLALGFLVDNRV